MASFDFIGSASLSVKNGGCRFGRQKCHEKQKTSNVVNNSISQRSALQPSSRARQRRLRHDNLPGWPAPNNWMNREPKTDPRFNYAIICVGCRAAAEFRLVSNQREPESSLSFSFPSFLTTHLSRFIYRWLLPWLHYLIHQFRSRCAGWSGDDDVKVKDSKALVGNNF